MKEKLTQNDYKLAALQLRCEFEAIMAVAKVESLGSGFFPDGTPVILFEAHIFSKLTGGEFDKTHPNISSPIWNKNLYGPPSRQHLRLNQAAQLNRDAALKSCSWGKFQLMGVEWRENGYESLQAFVNAMYRSEKDHLDGFVAFVKRKASGKCWKALQELDWAKFAYYYNGPGYKSNNYDVKIKNAYEKLKGLM